MPRAHGSWLLPGLSPGLKIQLSIFVPRTCWASSEDVENPCILFAWVRMNHTNYLSGLQNWAAFIVKTRFSVRVKNQKLKRAAIHLELNNLLPLNAQLPLSCFLRSECYNLSVGEKFAFNRPIMPSSSRQELHHLLYCKESMDYPPLTLLILDLPSLDQV